MTFLFVMHSRNLGPKWKSENEKTIKDLQLPPLSVMKKMTKKQVAKDRNYRVSILRTIKVFGKQCIYILHNI